MNGGRYFYADNLSNGKAVEIVIGVKQMIQ